MSETLLTLPTALTTQFLPEPTRVIREVAIGKPLGFGGSPSPDFRERWVSHWVLIFLQFAGESFAVTLVKRGEEVLARFADRP